MSNIEQSAANSVTVQTNQKSDDALLNHIKSQEAKDAESWKKAMDTSALKNRERNTKSW